MKALRVALYARVSTDEQAKHGISSQAQVYNLQKWITDHNYIDAGHYVDEGISGGKPIEKRPAMYRLLQDVQSGLIDMIIFTKLDRWFRSLPNYYKAQEILERYHCAWQAIDEDYETLTSAGRFKCNIMLSVAQQERERTSERIRSAFTYKRAKGDWLTGGRGVPFGYKLENKKLIKDPALQEAVSLFWHILATEDVPYRTAARRVQDKYGNLRTVSGWSWMVHNPIYCGLYDGNPEFCEPYISKKDFDRLQAHKMLKRPRSDRVYLFVGLLICPLCGNTLVINARHNKPNNKDYIYYRCQKHDLHECDFKVMYREEVLEAKLIEQIFPDKKLVIDYTPRESDKSDIPTVASIQAKMLRLGETYTDGLISQETYRNRLAALKKEMVTAQEARKGPSKLDPDKLKEFIQGNVKDVYNRFTKAEKKRFWRTIINKIEIADDGSFRIYFL